MTKNTWGLLALLAVFAWTPVFAQEKTVSGPAVTGTVNITFNTRMRTNVGVDGKPNKGVKDIYFVDLAVGKVTIKGKIERTPKLAGWLGREAQRGSLYYALSFALNGTYLGDWLGTVVTNDAGYYLFDGSGDPNSRPRISVQAVGNQASFVDYFSGVMIGKGSTPGGVMKFTRKLTGGKEAVYTAKNADPMDFQQLGLAKGPLGSYSKTVVSGKLIYDRESGSWITEGLRFTADGKKDPDTVTGSVRWLEDPNRAANGKGDYDFNLRWNEDKQAPTEDNFIATDVDEDNFFAVDQSKPGLTGKVTYLDKFEGETVVGSTVTYALNANGLTRNQIMSFMKLWLAGTGPLNDE